MGDTAWFVIARWAPIEPAQPHGTWQWRELPDSPAPLAALHSLRDAGALYTCVRRASDGELQLVGRWRVSQPPAMPHPAADDLRPAEIELPPRPAGDAEFVAAGGPDMMADADVT